MPAIRHTYKPADLIMPSGYLNASPEFKQIAFRHTYKPADLKIPSGYLNAFPEFKQIAVV